MMNSVTGINVNNQNYQTAFKAKKPNRKEMHEFIDGIQRQMRLEELKMRSPEEYKCILERESVDKATLSAQINMAIEFVKKMLKKS